MSELTDALPCPFCGATQHIHTHEGSTFRWMLAECGECGAQGPEVRVQTLGDGTPEEWAEQGRRDALAEWNRRSLLAAHEAKQQPDVNAALFWCHEVSHDKPRCERQCAECAGYEAPAAGLRVDAPSVKTIMDHIRNYGMLRELRNDNEALAAFVQIASLVRDARGVPGAPAPDLRSAAQAVLDRWNSPKWEWAQQGPTADLMADLARALGAKAVEQPVWLRCEFCHQLGCANPASGVKGPEHG